MGFYTGAISQKKIQSGEKDTVEETGGDKEVETEERHSGVTKEKRKGGKWWRGQMMRSQR